MVRNIDTVVQKEFGATATKYLGTIIRQPAEQVSRAVEHAISEILDGLSIKARDEAGREAIYETARYNDDGLIDNPAYFFAGRDQLTATNDGNNTLALLLGIAKRDAIADSVKRKSGLSAADANAVTGFVAPGVLGVLKREMQRGDIPDSSTGISRMLSGDVTTSRNNERVNVTTSRAYNTTQSATNNASVVSTSSANAGASAGAVSARTVTTDTATTRTVSTGTASAGTVSTGTASAGTVSSGTVSSGTVSTGTTRTGTVSARTVTTGTSPTSTVTAAAEGGDWSWFFRWMLPVLLMGGLIAGGLRNCGGDYSTRVDRLAAVDTDNTVTESNAADNAQLLSLQSELDAARGESVTLKTDMQSQIDAIVGERDKAIAGRETAEAEIGKLKTELEQASVPVELDTTELDAANIEIASLKDQIANKPDNSAQIMSLQQQVDSSALNFSQLESELTTTTSKRDELQASLSKLSEEKAAVESKLASATGDMEGRLAELTSANDGLTSELATLKQSSTGSATEIEDKEAQIIVLGEQLATSKNDIEGLSAERDQLAEVVERSKSELDQLRVERDELTNSVAGLTAERDNAMAATKNETAKLGVLNTNIGDLQNQLAMLTTAKDDLGKDAGGLREQVTTLEAQVATLKSDVESANSDLKAQQDATAGAEGERDGAMQEIVSLKQTKRGTQSEWPFGA